MRSEFSRQRKERKVLQEQERSTASAVEGTLCPGEREPARQKLSACSAEDGGAKPTWPPVKGLECPEEASRLCPPWMVPVDGWEVT